MSYIDRIFKNIDRILYNINELFAHSSKHYIRLETALADKALVADDGSLISMLKVRGVLSMVGGDEFSQIVSQLHNSLANNFMDTGHHMQIVFQHDPEQSKEEVTNKFSASQVTAQNLNIDIGDILEDWSDSVSKWCAVEDLYIILWTRPFVLPKSEEKKATKKMYKEAGSYPFGESAQPVGKIMKDIDSEHQGIVSAVISAFSNAKILVEEVSAHDMMYHIRNTIDPEFTSRKWKALLPGDKIPQRLPDPGQERDLSHVLYPTIASQVWPRESELYDRRTIRIGDRLHSPLVVSLPPQNPRPFNTLFRDLIGKGFPWRISFLLSGDGMSVTNWKRAFTTILHWAGSNNKQFNNAVERLKNFEIDGGCVVGMKISLNTWVNAYSEDAEKQIHRQSAELAAAVQSWGTCDTQEVVGDPLLGVCGTIPGIMPTSPAPASATPFEDAIGLLPLTRPALPWTHGSLVLRTPDGKVMPYAPMSSHQTAWVDIGVAPMGFGKSVFLNSFNLAYLLQPGLSRLPWLSIIDIGPSSSGLISLIKASLPKEYQYLASYKRLRMTPDYAINPFDLPLGFQEPTPQHLSFLVNLISLLATPIGENAPEEGISGLTRQVIKMTYDEFSQNEKPKLYNPQIEPELHEKLLNLDAHLDKRTSWWEVRDIFFEHGYIAEATKAQRYAVPVLADVAARAKYDIVKNMYKHYTKGNELITDHFWRLCLEAINAFPILKEATKFDIGSARIISLDLDEVAPKGGEVANRQSGVMYMLARHVTAGHLFLMPEDVQFADDKYKEYQSKRVDEIRQDPKRVCYDEAHRVTKNKSIADQLVGDIETSIRESRKWSLSVAMYSQSLKDIPEIVTDELATNVFILGGGAKKSVEDIGERLGLNSVARQSIMNIHKPDKKGANFIGVFRTNKGFGVHMLTNTLGPMALAAFNTTDNDIAVRDNLYKQFPVKDVLKAISQMYPNGIKPEVEKRKQQAKVKGFDEKENDIVKILTDEIASNIQV